jgi:hypothetical protein
MANFMGILGENPSPLGRGCGAMAKPTLLEKRCLKNQTVE